MWFLSRIRRRKASRKPARVSRFLPRLEALEERTLLSTLTVLNTLDSGAGSLRDAIKHAKSGDTIAFTASLDGQAITLTSDQLTINKSLDIEGPGANLLAISGNDLNRVFNIPEGLTVTIAGLTITHGRAGTNTKGDTGAGGGGILNAGTLTVASDVLSSNHAEDHGGAISNLPAAVLTTTDSTFINNQAVGKDGALLTEGGAVYNSGGGAPSSAAVVRCTFIGNKAIGGNGGVLSSRQDHLGTGNGGALHNDGTSTLTVIDSIFIGNQASGGNGGSGGNAAGAYLVDVGSGGAIANDAGTLVVSGCAFSYNQAIGGSNATGTSGQARLGHAVGGAITNLEVATITNSTFDHNEALGGNNNTGGSGALIVGRGAGGAIDNFFFSPPPVTLTLSNCTFTSNQAVGGTGNSGAAFVSDGIGGGLINERGTTATVMGSTFIGNQAIGGQRSGGNGADGLGGGIANILGSTLTVSGCMLSGNQAIGGAGATGGNGGSGFGGGLFNDGVSIWPTNAGTPATLTVLGSTIGDNHATGGAAGSGGSAGLGQGGGLYLADGGAACLDAFTITHVTGNHASTSNDDIFGAFTPCP
jgi:hypothetical protein